MSEFLQFKEQNGEKTENKAKFKTSFIAVYKCIARIKYVYLVLYIFLMLFYKTIVLYPSLEFYWTELVEDVWKIMYACVYD